MDLLIRETAHAMRALRKNPAFALTAIATLALGIGASTAIFSVVNAVLLRPLPYADADRLVLVWGDLRNRNVRDFPFSPGDFADLRTETKSFTGLAGVNTGRQPLTGDNAEPEQVKVAFVTTNVFSILGTRIVLGRNFSDADGLPQPAPPRTGAPPGPPTGVQAAPPRLPTIAILGHAFWQRRYGGDSSIVGRAINLGANSAQVVGIAAPDAELLFPLTASVERLPDVWVAARIDFENSSRKNVFLRVVGRLKPGVSAARAQDDVELLAADLRRRFPIDQTAGVHFRVEPMQANLVAEVRAPILALMGAVTFVLLIACLNVANLLLVRASWREREFAVRAALGGSRWRLVRQMLAESLVLAGIGALLGLVLASLGIKLLIALSPPSLPRIDLVRIDPLVLAFTAGVSVLAAVVFGLAPAVRASRPDLADVLRASGRTPGLQRAGRYLRNGVVMAEVALSFVLLIGCGLMVRSFVALQRVDPGYDANGVLTFLAANARVRTPEQGATFARQMHDRLAALPGVVGVTAAFPLPLDGGVANVRWGTERALADPTTFQQANVHFVMPGYFEVMRARLIAGRAFTEADNDTSAHRIIIDDVLAAKAFPGASAVGKRLLVRSRSEEPEWLEVIGVVGHERQESLTSDEREGAFLTQGFIGGNGFGRWVVRTTGDPARLVPQVRAEIARIDPMIPLAEVRPMRELVDHAMAPTRFALVLIAIFGAIASVLAAVGLYGVLSTVVRQRTAEIGVRMAFGAPRASIFRLVIEQGLALSGAGIIAGVAGALALTRVMSSMLVGVDRTDPLTYVVIVALFFAIATIACVIPAKRAASLDPTAALREE